MSATETTRRKLIPAISPCTLTIIGIFRELINSPEKLVTKEELRVAIGRDPMGLVQTAIRHMLRDHGIVIEWDRTARGWRNMVGADNLLNRKDGISSLRRKSRRESEKLSVIDFGKLSDPQKLETCAVASVFGTVTHFSTSSTIRRIEGAVEKASVAGLPIGKTLALFHENGTAK